MNVFDKFFNQEQIIEKVNIMGEGNAFFKNNALERNDCEMIIVDEHTGEMQMMSLDNEISQATRALECILLDDDEIDRKQLVRLLADEPYKFTQAATFDEFKQLFATKSFDLIFLDYQLQGITAFNVVEWIRLQDCDTPLILLTGYDSPELDHKACEYGFADYLPKDELTRSLLIRCIRYARRDYQQTKDLQHLAHFDSLTGLMNRHLFFNRIQHVWEYARRYKQNFAVVYIDLDNFKYINDQYGHDIGDKALIEFAARISACVRTSDSVARLGGDEFTLILERVTTAEGHMVVQKILIALAREFVVDHYICDLSASIGLAFYNETHKSFKDILAEADQAMYAAKSSGKKTYRPYSDNMLELQRSKLFIDEFNHAINEDHLKVYYQPVIDLTTHQPVMMELLPRWQHPRHGFLEPNQFLPVVFRHELENSLIQHIIARYLEKHFDLLNGGKLPAMQKISINIGKSHCIDKSQVEALLGNILESGLVLSNMCIEIPIAAFDTHVKATEASVEYLINNNVECILDGFGVTPFSTNLLARLPIKKVKLDPRVMRPYSQKDHRQLDGIMKITRALSISTIATGIETERQLQLAKEMGCDQAQGFLFQEPLPL